METGSFESTNTELQRKHGQTSSSSFDDVKHSIADKLQSVAKDMKDGEMSQVMGEYGPQVSNVLNKSAEYIHKFDYRDVNDKVQGYVKEKPGPALLIAGAVGLIIGALFRRR